MRKSVDPGVRGQGATRSSYQAYSGRAATPPAGAWAAEFRAEPFLTGHYDFAAALSATPPRVKASHVARLREVGIPDAELSDIVHAARSSRGPTGSC